MALEKRDDQRLTSEQTVQAFKASVRKRMVLTRNLLDKNTVAEKSDRICKSIAQLPVFKKAQHVAFYLPSRNEVELTALAVDHNDKAFYAPCLPKTGRQLIFRRYDPARLVDQRFGLQEPAPDCETISYADLDLVLVPALAIDDNGNRIGFGAGYYDATLGQISAPSCVVVYEFQRLVDLPAQSHDIPINHIVSA